MTKFFKYLFLVAVVALTAMSCKSEGNIPVGVYNLPENENFDVDAAPGHLVIIDFNADWCMPCKRFEPIFKAAAEKYQGQVEFVSVNVDQHKALAEKLQIMSIPAVLFISPDGTKNWQIGFMTEEEFDSAIQSILNK